MTDFFAQSLQAFQEQMRTPWIGSILIAFLLWNWQPLLFLFASDTALPARFAYFEIHTDWRSLFACPIATGFLFAAAKPWISLFMDWLGAWAIHRSRLHADRLAEDRSFKRLNLQAASMKRKAEIENEIVDHAIERKPKIEEAQLNEDEKYQLQQDLDALQPTREEGDVYPIDEDLLGTAIFYKLNDTSKEILRALAQLDDGLGIVTLSDDDPIWARLEIIDPESHRAVCDLTLKVSKIKRDLATLEEHKLVTIHDHNFLEITEFGRKVASISAKK